jgi:hypothetical protein
MAQKFAQIRKLDLRKYPLRGIVTEIAIEKGVSRQAVSYGLRRLLPQYCEPFFAKRDAALRSIAKRREEMDHVH